MYLPAQDREKERTMIERIQFHMSDTSNISLELNNFERSLEKLDEFDLVTLNAYLKVIRTKIQNEKLRRKYEPQRRLDEALNGVEEQYS